MICTKEATAASLIGQLGRRNVFRYLNPFPGKSKQNVKGASTLPVNTITILTGPDDYKTFLDGLAGEYVGKDGAAGANGKDGADGRDGFGFDDLTFEQTGERSAVLRFAKGEQVKEFAITRAFNICHHHAVGGLVPQTSSA